jgi:hypothetical protein
MLTSSGSRTARASSSSARVVCSTSVTPPATQAS